MSESSQFDALIAYLEQHRHTYDHEALRQRLLSDGAPPELVEQAFARVYGDQTGESPPVPVSQATTTQATPTTTVEPSVAPGVVISDPAYLARVRTYLEEHRHTYDRNALRQKLLSDGHDQATIDLAMAQVYGFQVTAGAPPAASSSSLQLALIIIGVFLFNYLVIPIIIFGLANLLDDEGTAGYILAALILLAEIVAAVAFRRRNRTVSRGLTWGLAATLLPIAALALLFGICVALIGGLSGF